MLICVWSSDGCSSDLFSVTGNFVGEQRFKTGDCIQSPPGIPILADAVAALTCELRHAWEIDTHVILIGAVNSLRVASEEAPLVYRNGHFGTWTNLVACGVRNRSEEHTSELQSLLRISYAVFCLKKKKKL